MRNSKSPQKENGIVYANIGFIFSAFSCFYSVCLLFAFLLRTIVIHIMSIQYISGFFTYQILGFTLSFITAATALILCHSTAPAVQAICAEVELPAKR